MKKIFQECVLYCKDLKILYVEDNQDARTFTLEMLKRFFQEIVVAEDGEDGLNKFKDDKFDIILTDINMPKMNGVDMIKEIKKIDKSIPTIILSAHNEEQFFLSGIKIGVDGYLLKPLDITQFVETLKKSVEKIHLQKKIELYKQELESTNLSLEVKVEERTAELEYKLYHDVLTNLGNHKLMMKNIPIDNYETLFLIDINGFQKFNDIYGLESGNKILEDIAQKLIDFDAHNIYNKYRVHGDVFVLQYKSGKVFQEDFEIQKTKLLDYLETIKVYLDEIEEDVEVDFTIGTALNEKNAFIKTDMALKFAKRENLS
ncbi:MAG: response regulator, partial [Sulfurimonas sp.]|nr:response regulator [Sulfurimonas sp.]